MALKTSHFMKNTFIFTIILVLISLSCKNAKTEKRTSRSEKRSEIEPDSLFQLAYIKAENYFRITPPKKSNFHLHDSSAILTAYKFEDFNGDKKEDVMIDFGGRGTGGSEYGIFLNEYGTYYRLVFMDYLKGPQFEKEKDGSWSISSYEELRAYDPSRLHVAVFKFDQENYYYDLDTAYIYYDTIMSYDD